MKNDYRKIAAKYGLGTFIAQVISFLAISVISHIYSPSTYGRFITIISSATILLPLVTMKIESLISISDRRNEIAQLKEISKKITRCFSLFVSVVTLLILLFYSKYSFPTALQYALTLGLVLFFQSQSVILIQVILKNREFKRANLSGIIQNSATVLLQTILGITKSNFLSLQIGFILGRALGLLPLYKKSKVAVAEDLQEIASKMTIGNIIARGKIFIGISFVEAALISMPVFLLYKNYGSSIAGLFGLIQAIYLVPVNLISSSIGAITFSGFSEEERIPNRFREEHQAELFSSFAKPLLLLSMLFIFCSFILSKTLLNRIISSDWDAMYQLIPIMTFFTAVNFLWYPLMNILNLQKRSLGVFLMALGRLISALIGFGAAIFFSGSWLVAVNCFLACQMVFQLSTVLIHHFLGKKEK